MNFGHVLTAMVTPFDCNLEVDYEKVTQLVEHLIHNGTDCIVVAGTTGESPTLTTDEKVKLIKHVIQVVNKRIPVIAGTGSNNTKASIELTKKAEECGADGIMLVAPYYNKPSQEGLYQHFKAVAEQTKLPIMLYNIPGRSVVNIAPETVVRLSKIPNIVALKDAGGNLNAMTEVIAATDDDFSLYSGDDGLTLPTLAVGAVGIVSVASHVIGNEMQEMIKAFHAGDFKTAAKAHQHLLPFFTGIFMAPNPTPIKKALQIKGIDVGGVRLPLIPLNEKEDKVITTLCSKYF